MTNPMQPLDPQDAPDPITPRDTPSYPAGFASVMPSGQGPAWYNIEAPLDDLAGIAAAARDITGGQEGTSTGDGAAGFGNMMGPRQSATATMMNSGAGFSSGGGTSGYDILPGWSGSSDDPGDGWPNNTQGPILETPVQGQVNTYPESNTGTD